jgi:hypothetical protein
MTNERTAKQNLVQVDYTTYEQNQSSNLDTGACGPMDRHPLMGVHYP